MSAQPDLSEFYKLSQPKSPPCQIGLILSGNATPSLAPNEVAQLEAALAVDKGIITAAAIQHWLKARDHDSNAVRIANHRNGVCRCGKE